MCGSVQKLKSKKKTMHTGIRFFLPLVVDTTGPAQANYSLPGLFYIPPPQSRAVFRIPTEKLHATKHTSKPIPSCFFPTKPLISLA